MHLKVLHMVIPHHPHPRWHRLVHKWPTHRRWRVSPGLTQQLFWLLCAITCGSQQQAPCRCPPEPRAYVQVDVAQLLKSVHGLAAMLQ